MPAERAQLAQNQAPGAILAMRFAAKEAIVKAMGTGFAHGIWIRDVGVVQNAWGKPEVVYSPRGEKVRRKLGIGDGHVTLTDEAGLIVAVAVLETAPQAQARKRGKAKAKAKPRATAKRRRVADEHAGVRHRDRAGRGVRPPAVRPRRVVRR